MNGIHDMGGMHGMGAIRHEENEPVFHHEWERRAFALTVAAGFLGKWNIDMTRYARELQPPAEYLASTYYEHWLHGLERLLLERGLVTREELERAIGPRSSLTPAPGLRTRRTPDRPPRKLVAADVDKVIVKGDSTRMPDAEPPRFRPGDHVVTRKDSPVGHTRLPRYARGRCGVVARDHGVFVFPDTSAMEQVRKPEHCYSVRFTARELWGRTASPSDVVHVDLFDDYLEPA